jgi:hypothetical protein
VGIRGLCLSLPRERHDGHRHGPLHSAADLDVELVAELAVLLFERPTYARIVLGWDSEVEDDQVSAVTTALLGSGLGATVTG